jgi:hypothetical protein
MTLPIITIVSLSLIAFLNAEMDKIKFKPRTALFKFNWWVKNGNIKKSYLQRTVLSFTLDGWHFCKAIMRIIECFLFAYLFNDNLAYVIALAVLMYAYIGIVFEIWYED